MICIKIQINLKINIKKNNKNVEYLIFLKLDFLIKKII
jgi:hypothetical protein